MIVTHAHLLTRREHHHFGAPHHFDTWSASEMLLVAATCDFKGRFVELPLQVARKGLFAY